MYLQVLKSQHSTQLRRLCHCSPGSISLVVAFRNLSASSQDLPRLRRFNLSLTSRIVVRIEKSLTSAISPTSVPLFYSVTAASTPTTISTLSHHRIRHLHCHLHRNLHSQLYPSPLFQFCSFLLSPSGNSHKK